MEIRTGIGYDVHKLAAGYELWLGGIRIPHALGSVGHSDADVLIHVMCDALLGAMDKRDIGYHFPDTDPQYKGIDSKELLKKVMDMVREEGWSIGNIDSVIILQAPKVNPHIPEMKRVLAGVTGLSESQLNIKATTSEYLGFVGRAEGIAALATTIIHKT